MTKKPKDPNVGHVLGKKSGYGYQRYADGTIGVSPSFDQRMTEILDEQRALHTFNENANDYITRQWKQAETRRRAWWDDVFADLEFSHDEEWTFSRGVLKKKPPEPKEPEPTKD